MHDVTREHQLYDICRHVGMCSCQMICSLVKSKYPRKSKIKYDYYHDFRE